MQSSNIFQLNDGNLADFVSQNAHVVINFYSDHCTHCTNFKPVYQKLASKYDVIFPDNDVYFASVNGQLNPSITEDAHIRAYPSVVYYKNGTPLTNHKFEDERTVQKLMEWIHAIRYDGEDTITSSSSSTDTSSSLATPTNDKSVTADNTQRISKPTHSHHIYESSSTIITPSLLYAVANVDIEDNESIEALALELQQIPMRILTVYPLMILTTVWISGCISGLLLYALYTYNQQRRYGQVRVQHPVQQHLHVQ
jgi:thiol-disulfide isomerase/thioredoxin